MALPLPGLRVDIQIPTTAEAEHLLVAALDELIARPPPFDRDRLRLARSPDRVVEQRPQRVFDVLGRVAVRADWAIERSTCTYTLRSSSGYLRVTARFEDGDWTWSPLEQVDRVAFRPVARLSDNGRLDMAG